MERSTEESDRNSDSAETQGEQEEQQDQEERDPPPPLQPGSVLAGRYHLEQILGQGGSGIVFRAFDTVVNEGVALKVLRPDRALQGSWIKRLVREVKVARAIRHPNVCRVFEVGHADGHWFIIMELATGGTLRDLLRTGTGSETTASSTFIARNREDRLVDARAVCAGLSAIGAAFLDRSQAAYDVSCQ